MHTETNFNDIFNYEYKLTTKISEIFIAQARKICWLGQILQSHTFISCLKSYDNYVLTQFYNILKFLVQQNQNTLAK